MEMRASLPIQDFQEILQSLELCEGPFQMRILRELKKEILLLLPDWGLGPAREDYFLHQLNQAWSFEDLLSLVSEINSRHLQQNPTGSYAHLSSGLQGLKWELKATTRDDIH